MEPLGRRQQSRRDPATLSLDESFRPPRWLHNRHVQSILPSLPPRRRRLARSLAPLLDASSALLLDCGDGVRLQGFHAAPPRRAGAAQPPRIAMLLHGWEGSADSIYVLSLARELFQRGFEVLRLNLRDHGETHHLNRELFHSCRLPEVIGAVRYVQSLFPETPLSLAGFSLGGNFMLRVAARAGEAGLRIAKVVAISPVLDPAATLAALESGFPAYHGYFVRKWVRSLALKQAAWPQEYDLTELRRTGSVRAITTELVRRFTEFASLEEYLAGYAIVGPRLAGLAVPATLIMALDDPIIPARDLERLAPSAALRVITTRRGGHCGFLERIGACTWAERKAAEELDSPSGPASS
ncbi:MAG TPA: alpha/beta fold hydrolase [Steroidobacteraceae bacterium]|nr:alpha/beta fold hydrolase [Steroidobacteraceae bacterium]